MTLALVKKTHAPLAPSKAHRWLPCPGSAQIPVEDPETVWAAEGTRKHAVLSHLLTSPVPLLAGDTVATEAGPYAVPLEVLEQCQEIVDFIEQYRATHADGWVVETETPIEIGSHVWPNMEPGECAGTADAVAYSWDELLVLDAKFGYVRVEARGNPQLLLYAAGLLSEVPFPIKWVTLCIAQPGYDGLVEFREHRMTADAVREWAFEQMHVVEEIQSGSHRLQADDVACRYCPARTACPARLAAADDALQESWMEERSLEELLSVVLRLRAICRDIEQRAMADLSAGKPVRGWKVVAARGKRAWPDDGVAERIAKDVLNADHPPEEMYDKKLKSPAQMEKYIYSHFGKAMTKKEVKTAVDSYAFTPTGAAKLVPESDPRPALEPAKWTLEDVLAASLEAGDAPD